MPDEKQKFTYRFAYDESMTEVAVIFTSDRPITPDLYLRALASWFEFCQHSLHDLYKGRPTLEKDPKLQ
jgi:hypothetical protein